MAPVLPSRYEDLAEAYRGRLAPNQFLLDRIQGGIKSMAISKGIRFLPIFGNSGSGKSCATREISVHLPDTHAFVLRRSEIESPDALCSRINEEGRTSSRQHLIAIVDQFEEVAKGKEAIPSQFVEQLSILDRTTLKDVSLIVIWLTTDREFQKRLRSATSRNARLLLAKGFTIEGPPRDQWAIIIGDTFSFHNNELILADAGVVQQDVEAICLRAITVGHALEEVGVLLSDRIDEVQNISEYRIVMVWPVADGTRMQRVLQFTRPREGYLLNWDAWVREFSTEDRASLPMHEYNRARLYFDMRLIPLRTADIHKLCSDLNDDSVTLGSTYLDRFSNTHLFHILSGSWDTYSFSPVRERESERAAEAKTWYESVTSQPVQIGKRLAKILREKGIAATHEHEITTRYATVKADVYIEANAQSPKMQILELKVYSSENTMPSSIRDQIRVTLRRHAQLAGFLQRQ